MFTSRIRILAAATAGAAALALAGCGSDDSDNSSTPPPPSTSSATEMPGMNHGGTTQPATRSDFNDADVTFLTMMYPHHAQAVEMAELVPSRSQNQQVITLAAAIQQAQAPEMEQFAALLHDFGKPAPSAAMDHPMDGVMTQQQMDALRAATGADFDRMWLEMMIEHHQGAIDMADTEIADGTNADTEKLAQSIRTTQQAEIEQMRGMLAQG